MKALKFAALKELLQEKNKPETIPYSRLEVGIPKGAITEISGPGKTEWVMHFLAEQPKLNIAWVEENFCIFPFSFSQRNVRLARVLFVDAGQAIEWSILQVLRAQIFPIVVIYGQDIELQSMRRIQLAAEKSAAAVLWLTPEPQNFWTTRLQVAVRRESKTIISQVLKRKF
jgi:hypothetical protein